MGEVWRGTDTRLKRDVAIKVLPPAFTEDRERLARFEREAQLLALLQHPSIASIYGLEEADGVRALVMELVEGNDLSVLMARGPMPFDETRTIALQIAEALEDAHEKGIVHRDLKPANVKVTADGRVKVLDFGLAKAMDPASGPGRASSNSPTLMNSPTLTTAGTQVGVILGTAAYMSPEQAKGQAVDKRADVWAFGVVAYEMLTGRRLFSGDSIPETLAGVLKTEIDFSSLPPTTPATTRRLLERCLERDPKRRLRDIGEARIALSAAPVESREAPAAHSATPRTRERLAFALVAVLCTVVVGVIALPRSTPPPEGALRLHLLPPEGGRFGDGDPVILSPDGRSVAFSLGRREGESSIAVRALDGFEVRDLPGSAGAYEPFWSPDGRSVGFFGTHLEAVDASGLQPSRKLAPLTDGRGASWGRRGVILYAPDPAGPLYRVDAAGGEPRPATTLDPTRRETAHMRPWFLPDGNRFLYFVRSDQAGATGIYAGSLDGTQKKQVVALDVAAAFAPAGFLLYVRDGRLVARTLDMDRLEVTGEPAVLATGLIYLAQFELPPVSVSETGRLVYRTSSSSQLRQVDRVDRAGKSQGKIGEPGDFNLDLSPDGSRLAVSRLDPEKRRPFIWIHDLARDVRSQLAPESPANGAVWSPDGNRIAYASVAGSSPILAVRPASGGSEQVLWKDASIGEPIDWSPDGKLLLVETVSAAERGNLVLVSADGSGAVVPFAKSAFNEYSGRFSPDGRFVAYVSDESGRPEIYIEPLPRTGSKWMVSRRRGDAPRWSGDGREVFYVEPGEREGGLTLIAVPVTSRGSELVLGQAVPLATVASNDYEPVAGGREFLVGTPVREAVSSPPIFVENWPALLARK